MAPVRTLVVAVDPSVPSELTLVRAAVLAARSSARLHVVHVVTRSLGAARPHDLAADAAVRVRLERAVGAALGVPNRGLPLTLKVVGGTSVAGAVLQYTRDVDADLLVLGTHGRPGPHRLLVGSVTDVCVARAPCPVLTVPYEAGAHEPSATAPVLAAVDLTARSPVVLREARRLATTLGAPLELVHVVRDLGPYTGLLPSAVSLREVDPARADVVEHRLARFVGDAAVAAVHVALGAPSRQVAAVAAARRAGTLVMGTNARAGVAHALVGSTVYGTLQRTECAVLTVGDVEPARGRPRTRARRAAVV